MHTRLRRGASALRCHVHQTAAPVSYQSADCKVQKKSVIGSHNPCWKYLVGAITTHGEAKRDLEFIGGDKDGQMKNLWTETRISIILPWDDIEDEAERLLESDGVTGHTSENTHADRIWEMARE